jgi:dTDP-4-dehydrorhamnose 3,5-epimerase
MDIRSLNHCYRICLFNMEFTSTKKFKDVLIGIRPTFGDERGWFSEVHDASWADLPFTFVKDNVSKSQSGTLRGLHFQNPKPQGKMVTVLQGSVVDFFVDMRKDSKTFGDYGWVELTGMNGLTLYVPEGFAHGFYVNGEEDAIFYYKCTDYYYPEHEHSLNFFDPDINIDYDFESIIANKKDLQGKRLKDFTKGELF